MSLARGGGPVSILFSILFSILLCPAARAQGPDLPPPPPAPHVDLRYLPPGCLSGGETNINLISVLFDYFDHHPGAVYVTASGAGVLSTADRWLVPAGPTFEGDPVGDFLTSGGAGAEPPRRKVLAAGLPVLDSPFEVVFQYPNDGHLDWLPILEAEGGPRDDFPDIVRREADLVELTDAKGRKIWSLELGPTGALDPDPLHAQRSFSVVTRVETPDGHATVYSLGKRVATGARLLAELRASARPGELRLHSGGAVPWGRYSEDELAFCGDTLAGLKLTAIVPGEAELALGAEALSRYARAHELPYLAANLEIASAGSPTDGSRTGQSRPFPRFRIVEQGGLTVAIIGLISRDQLARSPASVRAGWRLGEPRIALKQATEAIRDQLRRRPDLTVVLLATRGDAYAPTLSTTNVDVVIGPFGRYDTMALREVVELGEGARSRARARYPTPALGVRGNNLGLGRIDAFFEPGPGDTPPRLRRIVHESVPVLTDGPRDETLHRAVRTIQEAGVARGMQVLLPDVGPIVEADPSLHPLVWGDHVLHRTGFRSYPRRYPARFSDPLWMRFVTNVVRESLGAEVALSRNLPRVSDMVGPLTRDFVESWMRAPDSLRVVTLRGEALLALAARMRLQGVEGQVSPTAWLFASGLDPERRRIGGRPIDPQEAYRVAVTDFVAEMPALRAVFGGAETAARFTRTGNAAWRDVAEGAPLALRDVVEARLDDWAGDPPRRSRELVGLLADQSDHLAGRWMLRLDELSLSSARYANTDNVQQFAATRETRVTTPDNFSINVAANVGLVYDGPSVAWETRARAALQRIELDVPGQDIPPQEQADDVVLSTELRLNAVALSVGQDRVPLVPFFQVAYDTELTATPNPQPDNPDATFPHQQLGRVSLGAVSYPGPRFKEIRAGLLFQRDFSEAAPHDDVGLLAGYRLALPLFGPLSLQSDLDLRYTVDDRDDRDTDLGLVLAAVNKLLVGVTGGFSVFGFADAYLVRGKTPGHREVGGSFIVGGGVQLSRIFKL